MPPDMWPLEERWALRDLSEHFNPNNSNNDDKNDDKNEEGEGSEEEDDRDSLRTGSTPGTKRKRSGKMTRGGRGPRKYPHHDPWSPVTRLASIVLMPVLASYLQAPDRSDPGGVLNDPQILQNLVQEFAGDTISDAFMASYQYTAQLEARAGMDKVRWLFSMLLMYDLVRLIRPHGSGRVGSIMKVHLVRFLEPIASPERDVEGMAVNLTIWSTRGKKLNVLCETFGPGCLFYLGEVLSCDFLGKKFTSKGPYKEAAFAHLEALGLRHRADSSGANDLGQQIRDHLIQPFKEANQVTPIADGGVPNTRLPHGEGEGEGEGSRASQESSPG